MNKFANKVNNYIISANLSVLTISEGVMTIPKIS